MAHPSIDSAFYSSPRFVTHIDDAAIASLKEYYDAVLPHKGRILDVCSSWVSHYPKAIEEAAAKGELKITGIGMNRAELDANSALNHGRIVQDLNEQPGVAATLARENTIGHTEAEKLDGSTNVVSIDYLTHPVELLRSVRGATRQGGTVHLVISNRCFPTKAINRWLHISEDDRLSMVGDYLHFAGWKGIEVVELSDGKLEGDKGGGDQQGGLGGWLAMLGTASRDPLWVVRATNG